MASWLDGAWDDAQRISGTQQTHDNMGESYIFIRVLQQPAIESSSSPLAQ